MVTVALQQTINGVVFGSLYVLVALGLTLIYGVLVQINFAHADVVTIGAFAAYFFTFAFGGNYLISIGVALMVGAALGWVANAAANCCRSSRPSAYPSCCRMRCCSGSGQFRMPLTARTAIKSFGSGAAL